MSNERSGIEYPQVKKKIELNTLPLVRVPETVDYWLKDRWCSFLRCVQLVPREFKPGLDCKFHSKLVGFFSQVVKVRAIFHLSILKYGTSQHEVEITVNASIQLKFRPGLVKSIKKSCKGVKTDGNVVWEWFFPVLSVKSNIMDFSATPCFFFSLTDLILAQSIQFRFHTCMKRQRLSLHSLEGADVLTVSELMQISKLKFKLCWSFKRNST